MGADLTQNKSGAYFRDSYNDSSLLWQYDLSWWADVTPILENGNANPRKILDMMNGHKRNFALNIEQMRNLHNKHLDYYVQSDGTFKHVQYESKSESREEIVEYYLKKDREFREYLQNAIDSGDTIECSL